MIYYKLDTNTGECVYSGQNFTGATYPTVWPYFGNLFNGNTTIKSFKPYDNNKVTDDRGPQNASGMFSGCTNIEEVDFTGIDDGLIQTAWQMFRGCNKLEKIKYNDGF